MYSQVFLAGPRASKRLNSQITPMKQLKEQLMDSFKHFHNGRKGLWNVAQIKILKFLD